MTINERNLDAAESWLDLGEIAVLALLFGLIGYFVVRFYF